MANSIVDYCNDVAWTTSRQNQLFDNKTDQPAAVGKGFKKGSDKQFCQSRASFEGKTK